MTGIYALRDTKTESFTPPFVSPTPGAAERFFQDVLNDPQTQPGKFPGDFELWSLGTYDDKSGRLTPYDPRLCVTGETLIASRR